MADKVIITKKGFKAEKWDGEIRQYVETPIGDILHELRVACTIEDGVTLGDILSFVESADPRLIDIIGNYSWANCDAFHREVKKPVAIPSDLAAIELAASLEIDKWGAPYSVDVSGRMAGDEQRWAIDFTPVNEMRHVPVTLNPETKIIDARGDAQWGVIATAPSCFSLFEVLTAIYYEISFHGSPANRNEALGELMDAKAAVDSGTATLVPHNPEKESTVQ